MDTKKKKEIRRNIRKYMIQHQEQEESPPLSFLKMEGQSYGCGKRGHKFPYLQIKR
jgi:hypothetical protein